ncbi:hypothetical protein D3C80_1489120 [compost metagenome]
MRIAAHQHRAQKALQRQQQVGFILQWQALLPQRVVLIQHIQVGPVTQQAIEHLDASGPAALQYQWQVVVLQGIGVQVQRAVDAALFAQAVQHGLMVAQGRQADLAGQKLQHVGVLGHLQHVAVLGTLVEQPLHRGENVLDPLFDGLGTVVAEAAHP